MFKVIKKADILLFFILVILGLALSFFSVYGSTSGQRVLVTVDGSVYGTYDLSKNQTIDIKQHNHSNKITIKDRKVQMVESDCKNQICVNTGSISKTSQSIVCLPNRVVVEITGGKEDFDVISN